MSIRTEPAIRAARGEVRTLLATATFLWVSALFLWLPLDSKAAPQGPWKLPATTLTPPDSQALDPAVAVAADGTTSVVWQRISSPSVSVIEVASRPPGGSFGPPLQVSSPGVYSEHPAIGVAPDGSTVVAWVRDNGLLDVVESASRVPGAVFFSSPEEISGSSADIEPPFIAAVDSVDLVVWSQFVSGKYVVQQAGRPRNGSFSAPQDLSIPDQDAKDPQAVIAPDGTTTIAWHRFDGADRIIQERTRPPGGAFAPANNLSLAGADSEAPRLGVDGDGAVTAAWLRGPSGSGTVQVASRPAGQQFFGNGVDVSQAGGVSELSLSVSKSAGEALAWVRNDVPVSFIIQSSGRTGTGPFPAPVDLTPSGQQAISPSVVTAPDGTVTVAWAGPAGIRSATRTATGSFGPVTTLSGGGFATDPKLAVDSEGRVTAAWEEGQLPDESIEAASTTVDTTVHRARIGKVGISGPKKARKGRKVTFKVRVENSGNAVANGVNLKVTGRGVRAAAKVGKIAAGKSKTVRVRFRPRKPGKIRLTFRISSGNAGSKTAKRAIRVGK